MDYGLSDSSGEFSRVFAYLIICSVKMIVGQRPFGIVPISLVPDICEAETSASFERIFGSQISRASEI